MQPTVFFAIPCAEFYRLQSEIIEDVSEKLEINCVIEEDFLETEELWNGIKEKIDDSDFFVADISAKNQNVAIELGYALAKKPLKRIGIFTSSVSPIPSDAALFKYQEYSSLRDFRNKLTNWLVSALNIERDISFDDAPSQPFEVFTEDFMDQDRFLRRWFTPPGSSWHFSAEGLRLTQAHFPIQTTTLGLLKNYEFEFKARIDKGCIGWTVQTTSQSGRLPSFCVMFQLGKDEDKITPLIWNVDEPTPESYHAFIDESVTTVISKNDGWFRMITRVKGEVIEIEHNGRVILCVDLEEPRFKKLNRDKRGRPWIKQGNVGFRCYLAPNGSIVEEATVSEVKVRELPWISLRTSGALDSQMASFDSCLETYFKTGHSKA